MRYAVLLLTITIIVGCTDQGSAIGQLDQQNGFFGLVLGDSMYSDVYRQVREEASSYGVLERELLGHVILPLSEYEDLDRRFVFGVAMHELHAAGIDGNIHTYVFRNWETDSTAQRRLSDSLRAHFASPTEVADTTMLASNGSEVRSKSMTWQGQRVGLTYTFTSSGFSQLILRDIETSARLESVKEEIRSRYEAGRPQLDTLRVGGPDLQMTEEEAIERDDISAEDGEYGVRYKLELGPELISYLGLEENRKAIRYGLPTAFASINLSEETGSVSSVRISFPRLGELAGLGETSAKGSSYSELVETFDGRFGQYSLVEKQRSSEHEARRAYWLSPNVSIIIEEDLGLRSATITFHRESLPHPLRWL